MKTKHLYINTIGCQMNVYDSEQIAKGLTVLGYKLTSLPEKADLIIVNTCTIRKKAEQKAFSFLGRMTGLKRKKPDLIIGMGGCVAQQEGQKILQRVPHLDLVFGTNAIGRLPGMIKTITAKKCRIVDIKMSGQIEELDFIEDKHHTGKVSSFVTIMQGCDNYCTYCVVPYVRGRETSRNPDKIINEICGLVESGVREVTLLGQNVNSYGNKEGLCTFPELLARVNEIDGLLRIRFTTSHPKDLSTDLMLAFKDLNKMCNHIHLPIQSGSNRVLKRMNRKYSRKLYLEKIDKLRDICSNMAITSDIIVGFPGETRTDFQETLDLIKKVEFDGLFAFKYSDRPNAAAARFEDKISEKEKKERLQQVLTLQAHFTTQKNKELVGSTQSILVEGLSKKQTRIDKPIINDDVQWTGRTSTNKIVNFSRRDNALSCEQILTGRMVKVRIVKAHSHSLWGEPVSIVPMFLGLRGEKSYVA
ncbi:MAG: tRNA (N6-isopentenyl adenosine(37)-C2)-methylthiotransferase MiaB [Deltaproteobacteria bacterium]|nr:tRNA (N6-isopentenyl adenosine(37)-C2)-methylthiotransferase MiaB [Deltaproteobacteria bacterium]MBW1957914.1 tRNA (N6-isopentenyl adenosine(37)-C2)-methylthiotransferase MiaB [Deltaproteobacteria bacterium]MBW2012644.1 tRNA (N6-isopentenyl adenosine(37)-C2)-methylthiotransferase MiaB [Deltaproteobacteria bacterium]MBW2087607.1 tRNA (N6-isopentenyl adenosine(37)-C2)-methylthiotransferase MiaB [Deltaproteobacteria bacterium]